MNSNQTIRIFEILMKVLADRSLVLVTLMLNFGLFAYAIYEPTEFRIIIASIFSVTCFLPILYHERKQKGRVTDGQEDLQAA